MFNRKQLLLYMISSVIVGLSIASVASLFSIDLQQFINNISNSNFSVALAIGIAFVGFVAMLLQYLNKDNGVSNDLEAPSSAHKDRYTRAEIDKLKTKIDEVSLLISEVNKGDLKSFIDSARSEILNNSYHEIEEKFRNKFEEENDFNDISIIFQHFYFIKERLQSEIRRNSRQGNLSLSLGIVIAVSGMCLLGYFVILFGEGVLPKDSLNISTVEMVILQTSRISLVIVIEVFGYFFLRIYKNSLEEIKFINNEITNIESKEIAARSSFYLSDCEMLAKTIDNLLRTERNFILKKGCSTVDIEKTRLENAHWEALAGTASSSGASIFGKRSEKE